MVVTVMGVDVMAVLLVAVMMTDAESAFSVGMSVRPHDTSSM